MLTLVSTSLKKTIPQVAAGDVFTFPPSKGTVVHLKDHRDGGLVDTDEGQWLRMLRIAGGLPDIQIGNTGDSHQIPQLRRIVLHPAQSFKLIQFADPGVRRGAVCLAEHHSLSVFFTRPRSTRPTPTRPT